MVVYTLRVGEKGKSGRTRPAVPIVGNMIDLLVSSPLLTLVVTMALGTLVGAIPFGPLRFGPAGALFVGLAIGALDPRLGSGLDLVESLGLALFVYTIGIASGASFFRQMRAQGSLLVGGVLLLGVQAALSLLTGYLFGFGSPMAAGMFAGSGAATPALSSANEIVPGDTNPSVGFAIAYPLAVVLGMLLIPKIARSKMSGKNDPSSVSATDLLDITVEVENTMKISMIPGIASVPGKAGGDLRISYLQRGDEIRVAHPSETLHKGDRVLMVGVPDAVHEAAALLGRESETHLANDRTKVNFRRFVVSNPQLAGRTVADLHIPTRFESIITRVRRGDTDMLAHAEMTLQLGDRVRVVMPQDRRKELTEFFGDSEMRITEVDFLEPRPRRRDRHYRGICIALSRRREPRPWKCRRTTRRGPRTRVHGSHRSNCVDPPHEREPHHQAIWPLHVPDHRRTQKRPSLRRNCLLRDGLARGDRDPAHPRNCPTCAVGSRSRARTQRGTHRGCRRGFRGPARTAQSRENLCG